ncbi:hypothetical protein Tco_1216896 [Tanacetum coccineum]
MGMRTVNTQKHNVHVVISKGVFGKKTFKATDNKVEINLDAAKELAEKKEFRRAKEHQAVKELAEKKEVRIAKKELDRRMVEQFTKIGALTARYGYAVSSLMDMAYWSSE